MKAPLVSVIIPCYNDARYLAEAIESVLGQSYGAVEIVVVDDGSTDGTASVCASYSVRRLHQPNSGLAAARNTGIRESSGDYVLFLDADDRLCPEAIERAVRFISQHPECGFVYGRFRFVNDKWEPLEDYDQPPDNPDNYPGLFRGNHIAMCATVLFPRAVLERAAGFRAELRASEDYDLYFRIARHYPYKRHDAMMAECRRHDGNMSLNAGLMLRYTLQVVRAQRPYVRQSPELRGPCRKCERIWKDYYGGLLLREIRMNLRQGEGRRALGGFSTMARWAPGTLVHSLAGKLWRKKTRFSSWATRPFRRLTPVSADFGYDRGIPIDRYYIERVLAQNAADVHGHVLEVKDDSYTRRFGGLRVAKADVLDVSSSNPSATVVADLSNAPHLADQDFDCILITQTLHLIYDVHAVVATLHRILKPGGTVLATLPGISQIARDGLNRWHDCWRFTPSSAQRLFKEVFGETVTITAFGNLCTAINYLDGRASSELSARQLDYEDPDYPVVIFVRAVKQ